MKRRPAKASWFILLTLLLALALTILPLPAWAAWIRPLWVLMVLSYWAIALEHRVSVGYALVCGILLDVLQGTTFGEHSFALIICIFIIDRLRLKIRMSSMMQQAVVVGMVVLLHQLIIVCMQSLFAEPITSFLFWLSSITSAIFWPWVFILLRDGRRRFKVS